MLAARDVCGVFVEQSMYGSKQLSRVYRLREKVKGVFTSRGFFQEPENLGLPENKGFWSKLELVIRVDAEPPEPLDH